MKQSIGCDEAAISEPSERLRQAVCLLYEHVLQHKSHPSGSGQETTTEAYIQDEIHEGAQEGDEKGVQQEH